MASTQSCVRRGYRFLRIHCCKAPIIRCLLASLKTDTGAAFDRDYVRGQVDYQKGNAALFRYEIQNGTDSDLKEFAARTLPKIEDHMQRALKLAKSDVVPGATSE